MEKACWSDIGLYIADDQRIFFAISGVCVIPSGGAGIYRQWDNLQYPIVIFSADNSFNSVLWRGQFFKKSGICVFDRWSVGTFLNSRDWL
jgi:hypothetical protein